MKKLIILITIVFSQFSFSQDNEEIYIYSDHGKGQEKFFQSVKDGLNRENPIYYVFYESLWSYLMMSFVKKDNPQVRIESKAFLKNENVIKADKLINLGLTESTRFLFNKKLFIIDTDEFDKKNITLREVRFDSTLTLFTNE